MPVFNQKINTILIWLILEFTVVLIHGSKPSDDLYYVKQENRKRRSSPLWGGRPADKQCMDFCSFINCNNGVCIQNQETCYVGCKCGDGYEGSRCTQKKEEDREMQNGSSSDVIRLSLSVSSTFSSTVKDNDDREKRRNIKTTTHRPFVSLFEGKSSDRVLISKRKENISVNPFSLSNLRRSGIDIFHTLLPRIITNKVTTPGVTKITKLYYSSTTSASTTTKDNESEWKSDVALHNDGLSSNIHPNNTVVKRPTPFKSVYFDDCKKNCTDGLCIAINQSFHCLPMQHYCRNGFDCGQHGVCDPAYISIKRYRCLCEIGWTGDTCSTRCDLDCGTYGICVLYDATENVKKCACHKNYTGVRCDKLKPKSKDVAKETWYWYVVGVCVTLAVLLTTLIFILPYWLWKKRWLFVMKIVHYFQQYEEDDGKEYDAFISYKSSQEDQEFVLQQLHPKLEAEMGFKLCLHFRDFTPGDAIANNIIQAIENSRRTIMVLSPNYVDSEWCRMEYQKAQHEMLKLKHKIIPIMFKDISGCSSIDKNLKTILNTVTYLEWPGVENSKKMERFWKQLELTLPKKRTLTSVPCPVVDSTVPSSNLVAILPPSSPYSASIPNITSYGSPITTETCTPNNVHGNKETITSDNKTHRIKRLMKDVLKLKINTHTNSFSRLTREWSVESGIVTPSSATPSPGMCVTKDETPLLCRKKPSHRRCKSLTWSDRTVKHPRSNEVQIRSLREKESTRLRIDVIPPSPDCVDNKVTNLPDICRTDEGSYYNIVCEEETRKEYGDESSAADSHLECNTCVLDNDSTRGYPTSYDNSYSPNIGPQRNEVCPTCLFNMEVSNASIIHNASNNMAFTGSIPPTQQQSTDCLTCIYPDSSNSANENALCIPSVLHLNSDKCGQSSIPCTSGRNNPSCRSHSFKLTDYEYENNSGDCETCILAKADPSIDLNLNSGVTMKGNLNQKRSFRIQSFVNSAPEELNSRNRDKISNISYNSTEAKPCNSTASTEHLYDECDEDESTPRVKETYEDVLSPGDSMPMSESPVFNIYESFGQQETMINDSVPTPPKRTKKLSRKVTRDN